MKFKVKQLLRKKKKKKNLKQKKQKLYINVLDAGEGGPFILTTPLYCYISCINKNNNKNDHIRMFLVFKPIFSRRCLMGSLWDNKKLISITD